jgi:hypothetical protein
MSVISAPRPLATGIDTAVQSLRKAQDRFGAAAEDVARQAAVSEPLDTKEGQKTRLPAQTPPNPGPPGGAVPGDLAQAMVAQQSTNGRPPSDLLRATIEQKTSRHETTADVKTVQAFDAMLEELSRMKATQKTEPSE